MKRNLTRTEHYSLATITTNSEIVMALLSVDLHTEQSTKNGALHLMYPESLLSGTQTKSRSEFLHAVNLLGASIDLAIHDGVLTISIRSTAVTFSKVLRLLSEMLTTPAFSTKELHRIQTNTINDLHASKEQSKIIAHQELLNTLYGPGDRKYTYSIDETIAAIPHITTRQLAAIHKHALDLPWTTSIAGSLTNNKAFTVFLNTIKRSVKAQKEEVPAIHQQKPPTSTAVLTAIPSRQNIDFAIGAPLPITLHHPDYIPLVVAIAVLGKWGGFTGRLMSTVREKEGLTYGIYAKTNGFSGTEQGFWHITTFFAPEKALIGLTSTFREISKLFTHGITKAELEGFKTILGTQQILLQDSVSKSLLDLHTYTHHQFTLAEIDAHKAKISQTSLDEVNQVIRTYLNPATLTISGAGPTKAVKKEIEGFMKSVS